MKTLSIQILSKPASTSAPNHGIQIHECDHDASTTTNRLRPSADEQSLFTETKAFASSLLRSVLPDVANGRDPEDGCLGIAW